MPLSKHDLSSLKKKHQNGKVLTTDEIDFLFSQAEAAENKEMIEIMVLQEIRSVLGDQGQMMQSELVECIRTLATQAEVSSSKSE